MVLFLLCGLAFLGWTWFKLNVSILFPNSEVIQYVANAQTTAVNLLEYQVTYWKLQSEDCRPVGLGVWFSLRVREVPGSNPGQAQVLYNYCFCEKIYACNWQNSCVLPCYTVTISNNNTSDYRRYVNPCCDHNFWEMAPSDGTCQQPFGEPECAAIS